MSDFTPMLPLPYEEDDPLLEDGVFYHNLSSLSEILDFHFHVQDQQQQDLLLPHHHISASINDPLHCNLSSIQHQPLPPVPMNLSGDPDAFNANVSLSPHPAAPFTPDNVPPTDNYDVQDSGLFTWPEEFVNVEGNATHGGSPSNYENVGGNASNAGLSNATVGGNATNGDSPSNYANVGANASNAGPIVGGNASYASPSNPNVEASADYGIHFTTWRLLHETNNCSYCQILREVIHANGNLCSKLEIHGRLGVQISHGILQNKDTSSGTTQYQIVDFGKKSLEDVKIFLERFCADKKNAGYVLLQDPLSNFYDALCVGIEQYFEEEYSDLASTSSEEEKEAGRARKPSLSEQRKKVKEVKLEDLLKYIHLPIEKAAKEMGLCITTIKKIKGREGGGPRWPSRQVQALHKKILKSQESAKSKNVAVREKALRDIQGFKRQLAKIYNDFLQRVTAIRVTY